MRFQRTSIGGLVLPISLRTSVCFVTAVWLAMCGGLRQAWASTATTTTLAMTAGGNVVTTVASGSVVTLTATVMAGGTAVTPGQVKFCDATAKSCTDIHLLGTAQLTGNGTTTLKFRPGIGSHSYKAVFLGTLNDSASASAAIELTVGPRPPGLQTTFTVASISEPVATNTYGTYALTASVGTKGAIPPSGTVSFSGTTMASNGTYTAYSLPGTATLGPASEGTGFLNVAIPQQRGGADAAPVVTIGDFNGDGIPDIVNSPFGGIAILLGNGDGTFAAPLVPDVDSGDGINAICVGDFNGDGITDLLVEDEDTGKLTVLLGKGDGTFTVGQSMPCFRASLAVADFNGDGKLDVALSGVAQATILLGNGDGTFTAAPNPPPSTSSQLVAADFNGDGKIDLALVSYNSTTFALTPITILLGNGDGTFTAAPSQPQFVASNLVAADFNGDGKIDLATINVTGSAVAILLGNGDGTFAAPSTLPTDPNFSVSAFAVGDFNGDGKPDVAIAASTQDQAPPDSKVSIFAGNGDGTFAAGPEVDSLLDSFQLQFAAADITGNGSSDLAAFGGLFLGNLTITTATADNVLPTGYNIIQADYAGDANNAPSSSTNAPVVLVPLPSFSLASSPVTVASGATASGAFSVTSTSFSGTLNLSCSISGPQNQANPPTCSVPTSTTPVFPNRTVNLTYTVTAQTTTPIGQYTISITATSTAGAVPPASTSTTVLVGAQNYQLSNTGATIASPGASGSSTITISPTGGYTGQVTMSCAVIDPANSPPTCAIPSPISVTGSPVTTTLTLTTQPTTTPGPYTISITGTSAGSLNATTTFTVFVPVAPPSFTLSSTAVTIASPGPSGTSTITITPSGGFTGGVALSCAVSSGPTGGTDAPTCSVTAPPAISGTTPVTATLTINTTPASSAALHDPMRRTFQVGGGAALAALLFFSVPGRRRRLKTLLGLLLFAAVAGAGIGCTPAVINTPTTPASPGAPTNPTPGTTPGSYTVTVTGTSGAITATTPVTITVN